MGQGRQRARASTGTSPPLYGQICNELIREISEGRLPPGSWLPTHAHIEKQWNVSNKTSRRVLAELEQAGWALSQGTRGYVASAPGQGDAAGRIGTVPDQPPATTPQQASAALDPAPYALPRPAHTIALGGTIPGQLSAIQIIATGYEPAPPDVAHALQLSGPGQPICVRRRLLTDPPGTITLELRVSYTVGVPEGSPLTQPAVIPGPWPQILATHTRQPTSADSYVTVRQPGGYEAPALQITPHDPVLVRTSTHRASDGAPVDQTVSIWPAATTTLYAEHHPLT